MDITMDMTQLKEKLKDQLSEIHQRGYIVSLRGGPTGVGKTMETLLGVKENNLRTPDLGNIEVKCKRIKSRSRVTMFTSDEGVWKIEQKELIKKYGYCKNEQWRLYNTAKKSKPNSRGFFVKVDQDAVRFCNIDGLRAIEWQLEVLIEELKEKLSNALLVHADHRRNSEGKEEFWYNEAYLLTGIIVEKFIEYMKNGTIVIDLRMHIKKNGVFRGHGTGFRLYRRYWDSCFNNTEQLL